MKTLLAFLLVLLPMATVALAAQTPDPAGPRSISELATLSNILVHHYECTADLIFADSSNREVKFVVQPLIKGETAPAQTIQLQGDKLTASANAQMLSLEWTRMGHVVATVKTMIQDSPARSYMMTALDPSNPDTQAQIYCNAVTFAAAASATAPVAVTK